MSKHEPPAHPVPPTEDPALGRALLTLHAVMARLRDPERGCPWDREQDFASIAPYTIEEAYEVADAIQRGTMADVKDELGDLLLQIVFHSQMAAEAGLFSLTDVADGIVAKLVSRHPHVFGAASAANAGAVAGIWETQKAAERAAKASGAPASQLDGVTLGLPALLRAVKLQKRAARVGFDWTTVPPILDKLREELAEFEAELPPDGAAPDQAARARLEDELGDLLFVMANLARRLALDPEAALRGANAKFERRFRRMEAILAEQGEDMQGKPLNILDRLWDRAKAEERARPEDPGPRAFFDELDTGSSSKKCDKTKL